MTFKLNPNPTFKAKVDIPVPGDKKQSIEFEFKHKDKDAFKEFIGTIEKLSDVDTILAISVGWSGVDADFSPESVALLVKNYHAAAQAIYRKYADELIQGRLGN
ncbi:phage tail assembly chaperone [Collimonas sp. NPDC087041]|uniref:phage tail assembly chaperone n=1 Tax=Collimonas sp. NPDC087041 TaxID=3363960 RepID=UPI00382E533B